MSEIAEPTLWQLIAELSFWQAVAGGMATILSGVAAFLSVKVFNFPENYPSKETFQRSIDGLAVTIKDEVKRLSKDGIRRENRSAAHVAGIYTRMNQISDQKQVCQHCPTKDKKKGGN